MLFRIKETEGEEYDIETSSLMVAKRVATTRQKEKNIVIFNEMNEALSFRESGFWIDA